ncbi:hypothetical protein DFA_02570 [Cavenderia fasciculata]|uniref:Uncharacterized protein n=1 Tax=Cavenderia fasciculata TaxID=261658 RepID=F4PZR7_CACFS|nr:uncharacterized protein DFA_02570 [Cavenderia fasciculata]EGG18831.1 hypothetical protein DFA_02570 [Cavenderia fasciculata]|eukprot:XP_004357293.1 hypothetical protein DFA_02570 [Cavenderia fasciculata]
MEKLTNIVILSQIISSIEHDGDIICLLLTCKKLYYNSGLRRSIQFKGTRATDHRAISATLFKINSFKDILENSVSDHQVERKKVTPPKSLYDTPSIETLFIKADQQDKETTVDLGSISRLPSLQRLSVHAHKLNLGSHTTLKTLKLKVATEYTLSELGLTKFVSLTELTLKSFFVLGIGPGLFPSSLTHLTLQPKEILPRDTFLSLTSLEYLDIDMQEIRSEEGVELFLDLESLSNLKTLRIFDECLGLYSLEINVPPSLKILTFDCQCAHVPHRCSMLLLEELHAIQNVLVEEKISLLSLPLLNSLVIDLCDEPVWPTIPSTVKSLTISKYPNTDILTGIVYPPSLTELSIYGDNEPVKLPASLIKLTQNINKDSLLPTLPTHLKELIWEYDQVELDPDVPESLSSVNYPPNLETLNLIDIPWEFTLGNIPPVKELSLALREPMKPWMSDYPIFSIDSRISITDQPQWLPHNTTHLACRLDTRLTKCVFRLDQVINHTNVRYLSMVIDEEYLPIKIGNMPFQFSIQRLDNESNNVLVLETNTLQGGIITQRKSINAQQQQQQQYDPIYLFFDIDSNKKWSRSVSQDAYVFKWSFEPIWKTFIGN